MFFEKKVTIFKKKDRETWQKIKDILREAGLKGVRSSHYLADSLRACGCGPKLDPRDFGANGWIDRDIYFIDVNKADVQKTKEILKQNGIEAVIEADPIGKLGRI